MTTCPTCQRPVDPLRAPVVGVRDGKVVSFCSKECAAGVSAPVAATASAGAAAASAAAAAAAAGAAPEEAPKAKKRARTQPPKAPPRTTPAGGVPTRVTPSDGVPKRQTPADGVPTGTGRSVLDSGPVIEIIREATSKALRGPEPPPIQVSETGRLDDYVDVDAPPSRGRVWLAVVLGVLVIGGGAAYVFLASHGSSHAAVMPAAAGSGSSAEAPATPATPTAAAPAAPTVNPADALARARSVLTAQLASKSLRIQRIAGLALARTGDPAALATLTAALATEPSELARLEIDYGLARAAGTDPAVAAASKRGADALVAALSPAMRPDVRDEAASRLVRLGDARGIPTLAAALGDRQHRLGAAEQLARMAEPRALEVLRQIRGDQTATADERARAVIALGVAGAAPGAAPVAPDVIADLHKLLPDSMAAVALAGLGDAAGRGQLVYNLGVPSLRVVAARALRRLDPKLDAAPLLPVLVAALGSGKDIDEVSAAEAILLLTGPAPWSAHP